MNRTEELVRLRPEIKTIKQDLKTVPIEQFQNDTLRSILKFQHDILILLFNACLAKNRIHFNAFSLEEKHSKLNLLFQKDLVFKNQSVGSIIGMLTKDEFATYSKDTSAYNKRIVTMLKQRIMSIYN
jgi:hypothetical protein